MPLPGIDYYSGGPHDDPNAPFEGDVECPECGNATYNGYDGCSDCGFIEDDEVEEEDEDD